MENFYGYKLKAPGFQDLNIFYIMSQTVFSSYKSEISLVETVKRQRKPRSAEYKENWDLLF